MSKWSSELSDKAERDLAGLDRPLRRRILDKLLWLTNNFDQIDPLPLEEDWRGFFKVRVGRWRVVYTIESARETIVVQYIDRRDKIYKRKKP